MHIARETTTTTLKIKTKQNAFRIWPNKQGKNTTVKDETGTNQGKKDTDTQNQLKETHIAAVNQGG